MRKEKFRAIFMLSLSAILICLFVEVYSVFIRQKHGLQDSPIAALGLRENRIKGSWNQSLAIFVRDEVRRQMKMVLHSLHRDSIQSHTQPSHTTRVIEDEESEYLEPYLVNVGQNVNPNISISDITNNPVGIWSVPEWRPGSGGFLISDVLRNNRSLPVCPFNPPDLLGKLPGVYYKTNAARVAAKHPDLKEGGKYKPPKCRAQQKIAIIIPFRERHEHLYILLDALIPVLKRQQADFAIFVVEQASTTAWNKGVLFNAGYLEALKRDTYDCFILQDVDMIPVHDTCLYRCADLPLHVSSTTSKFHYRLLEMTLFGGVVAISRKDFRRMNGASNLYFGWGGEDDDLRLRAVKMQLLPRRYPPDIGAFDMLYHGNDRGNEDNMDRHYMMKSAGKRVQEDGLNTVKYTLSDYSEYKLYTWLKVHVNITDIIQTVPDYMDKILPRLKALESENMLIEQQTT